MSKKETKQYAIIQQSLNNQITVKEAAQKLQLTERHVYRLRNNVRKEGARGLVHGNRGKESGSRIPEQERRRIAGIIAKQYEDFGPTLAQEKLEERHNISYTNETIRTIMTEYDLWTSKKQRAEVYRSRREPKEQYGIMMQFDGSYHPWLEERAPEGCLLAAIDDATGTVPEAWFAPHEGVFPVFSFWKCYTEHHGKPEKIYLDKLGTYHNNHPDHIDDPECLTQFQRAMKTLDVRVVSAHSPEAKGRVERVFRTFQDRLVKELRLAGINNYADANRFLKETFLPRFNARFAKAPRKEGDAHTPLTNTEKRALPAIFSRHETRVVQNDFTVRHNNAIYQLTNDQSVTIPKREKVRVEERLDGSVQFAFRGTYLRYEVCEGVPHDKRAPWILAARKKKTPSMAVPEIIRKVESP